MVSTTDAVKGEAEQKFVVPQEFLLNHHFGLSHSETLQYIFKLLRMHHPGGNPIQLRIYTFGFIAIEQILEWEMYMRQS